MLFKKRIFISVLLSILIAFSGIPKGIIANAMVPFETEKVIEAENIIMNNAIMQKSAEDASGGKYLTTNSAQIIKAYDIAIPDMSFDVITTKNEKYYLYVRAKVIGTSNDTTFYRINSNQWQTKDLSANVDFVWQLIDVFTALSSQSKIEINHGDLNMQYDSFFVTSDIGNVPTEKFGNLSEKVQSKALHEQNAIPMVKGNGITIEAEGATYYSPYVEIQSRAASGLKGIKASSGNKTAPSNGSQGGAEFRFATETSGIYVIWMRVLVTNESQDSMWTAVNNGTFVNKSLSVSDAFYWTKYGSVSCKIGETNTFKIASREGGGCIDQILITKKIFTPTGRTGGLSSISEVSKITASYKKPPLNPPSEHPRILFTNADIDNIKRNMDTEQNAAALASFKSFISKPTDGNQNGGYNKSILNNIEAFAFDYAINKNEESALIATDAILNSLKTIDPSKGGDDISRDAGYAIYVASEVYDWCYDKLTKEQRIEIIELCEALQCLTEMGWPPTGQGSVTGHGSEAQLLRCSLAFSIATYNERPDIWEVVGGRFYEQYIETKNYFNRAHYNLQGDSYGLYRHMWESWAHFLITGMGAEPPFNTEDLYKVSYSMMYMRRPDGQYMRDGDTAMDTADIWKYWNSRYLSYQLDSNIGKDAYLKDEFYRQNKNGATFYDGSPILWLVTNDPKVETTSIYNLPLSRYFGSPAGIMVARTSWEDGSAAPTVVAEMKVGEVQTNNHQHLDAGHFQIYYKGILASDSGVYQGLKQDTSIGGTDYDSPHMKNYATKTIAHNTMLILDPNEGNINDTSARRNIIDGGQRAVNNAGEPTTLERALEGGAKVASVVAEEIDPENSDKPYYSYLKGDLTNAYSNKVKEFKRSFMFLNLFDDNVPAAMIVFDKVTSSDASFKKTWLLHGLEEPVISGNTTVFGRTYKSTVTPNEYNGKLTVNTLLPEKDNLSINKVGGSKDGYSNVRGIDFTGFPSSSHTDEGSTWRIEVSPNTNKNTDYFLNVMFVSDYDKNYSVRVEKTETNLFYGASVADRAVYFSKSGERLSEGFELGGSGAAVRYMVCDLKSGVWKVEGDGTTVYKTVTEDGGILAFGTSAKSIKISPVDNEPTEQKVQSPNTEFNVFNRLYTKIDGIYTYCKPYTRLSGDSGVMPLSVITKYFNLSVNMDGDKIIVSDNKVTAILTKNSDLCMVNGEEITLGAAVDVIDGEVMISPRNFVEHFGGVVGWEPFARILTLLTPGIDYSSPPEYAKIKEITADDGEINGNNVCTNIADFDGSTIWAALGTNRYVQIELEKLQSLHTVEIAFNPNGGRNAKFEIMVSENGSTYKSVLVASGDGSVENGTWEKFGFEPQNVKYIRYYGHGSDKSEWNAIKEIRFK